MLYRKLLFIGILVFSQSAFSQAEYSGEVNLTGMVTSEENLPFWMHQNKRGRILENTNLVAWLSGKAIFETGFYSNLEIGLGGLIRDSKGDEFAVDEAYAHFETDYFYITAGIKHEEELYNGLSASNKSILWSLNAPAIPGLQIGTNGPVFFNPYNYGWGLEGSWEEYFLNDNRFVDNARLHNKNLFLVYRTENNFQIKGGLRHYAQWGGTSESEGPIPQSVADYVKVITASNNSGVPISDDIGSYELYLSQEYTDFSVEFMYNYLFETYSGARLANVPDGRYGIFLEFTEDYRMVKSVLYELYYTKNQGTSIGNSNSSQNYFNGSMYRSGWTYKEQVIGAPFFTADPDGMGVINNRFIMHHLGIGGAFYGDERTYPYKLLVSFGKNEGTYANPYRVAEEVLYWSYEMRLLQGFVDLNLQVAAEYNSTQTPVYGAGIHLRKQF